jgi:DNA adenine methylase
LFDFAHIVPFNLMYGMRNQTENSNQKGKEIFISNYQKNGSYRISTGQTRLFAEP